MKTRKIYLSLLAIVAAFVVTSCGSPVTLTSWKNPNDNSKISKVVVMPLFDKLEYMKPFEQSMDAYFNSQGLKALGSLDILNPDIKYPVADIKKKCDSLGADGILVFVYKGTDKSQSYVPPTTYTTGGFGGYWGGGYWGYSYSAVATASSYPWNRKDIYVDRSPLYSADKIKTPLLLLHGASDTNVPPGQSIEMFTALKILGRETEFITFPGEDHRILTYDKRVLFNKTILAWFDRWLKGQPDWWNDLYPQ